MKNMCTKCISFMFLKVHFWKLCGFVNLFLIINIYVFSSRFKEIKFFKNDISSFSFKIFKNWTIFLLMYGGIVVKMDNYHLFEMVLKKKSCMGSNG